MASVGLYTLNGMYKQDKVELFYESPCSANSSKGLRSSSDAVAIIAGAKKAQEYSACFPHSNYQLEEVVEPTTPITSPSTSPSYTMLDFEMLLSKNKSPRNSLVPLPPFNQY